MAIGIKILTFNAVVAGEMIPVYTFPETMAPRIPWLSKSFVEKYLAGTKQPLKKPNVTDPEGNLVPPCYE